MTSKQRHIDVDATSRRPIDFDMTLFSGCVLAGLVNFYTTHNNIALYRYYTYCYLTTCNCIVCIKSKVHLNNCFSVKL